MSKFDSIRPYDDSEVSLVLSRLVKDRDLQHLLISSSPILSKLSNLPFINLVAGQLLKYRTKKIKTRSIILQLRVWILLTKISHIFLFPTTET